MVSIAKKDFIELEFTGRLENGDIFDSNITEDLKKTDLDIQAKPLVICVGEKMFLDSIDEFLIGKEIGISYNITLQPEKAFGSRNSQLVKMVPLKVFHEKQFDPRPGMMLNIDGMVAKVISVSGGRTLVDFNNPLAGKTVEYHIKVIKKVEDLQEKAKALIQFFSRQDFTFNIDKESNKLVITVPEGFDKFFELFKDKFKDLLNLDLDFNIDKSIKLHTHDHDHEHEH